MSPEEVKAKADRAEGVKAAKSDRPVGRPSKYQPTFAKQAEKLCLLGATDADLADFFEVSIRTVERWRSEYEEFCRSIAQAKDVADARVERSLYHRAVGYEQDAVKIFMPAGADEPVYAPYRERMAPDTAAAVFWLKNRKPEDWREKQQVEHSGAIETKDVTDDTAIARRVAFLLAKGAT